MWESQTVVRAPIMRLVPAAGKAIGASLDGNDGYRRSRLVRRTYRLTSLGATAASRHEEKYFVFEFRSVLFSVLAIAGSKTVKNMDSAGR